MKHTMNRIRKGRRLLTVIAAVLFLTASLRMTAHGEEQTQLYGIGSTSKVLVTAAVMKLSEEQKIDLDSPLTDYIPEFEMADARYRDITPRMLLNHTSGLPGGTLTNAMLLGDCDTYNHDMLLTQLKPQRLKADPGEFAVYCNDGFTLAEILVERVSGMSFTDYLEHEFAGPLGLLNIMTPQSPGILSSTAPVFDPLSGKELPPEMANVIGSGGIYATAEDLVRLSGIFMRRQGEASGILSTETAEQMEKPDYAGEWNPDGRNTNLSYGLGWDCVEAYPFAQYGVKALVKGGDTNLYHASLTVLPEENISCAVLSSGGSSITDQLAVQEILMTYLEESGRIERQQEQELKPAEPAGEEAPYDDKEYAGWYAGTELFRVSSGEENGMEIMTHQDGHEKTQLYEYAGGGEFLSSEGNYISASGNFTKGSGGRTGRTMLEFKPWKGGLYLMASVYETYPGLGTTAAYLPVGEKLQETRAAEHVQSGFDAFSGKDFWLVSEKDTSVSYLTRFRVKPLAGEEPEGYLTFENGDLKPARITGAEEAEFFQRIPGQAGRDLDDYRLETRNGKTYLCTSGMRYLSESGIPALGEADGKAVIGQEGDAVWFSCGQAQQGRPMVIEAPSEGAWYVYDQTGKTAQCVASSWTAGEKEKIILPDQGKIVFVAEPGSVFYFKEAEE